MIRFYSPDVEETGMLPEGESAHCCRVLRMAAGDELEVTDGKGALYRCRLADANPKGAYVEVISKEVMERGWGPRITLAIAPTKNADRMEWLVEKVVEMGVDEIVLLACRHSERRKMRLDRLDKIIISAMKQSLKCVLPTLRGLVDMEDFLMEERGGRKYMGYCAYDFERLDFSREYDGVSDVTILIGPEGDFAPEEVAAAVKSGFVPVTFGKSRLRTETAGMYGVAAAHTLMMQQS